MRFAISAILLSSVFLALAANSEDDPTRGPEFEEFDRFTREAFNDYYAFRDRANKEYAEFMEQAWREYRLQAPLVEPKHEEMVIQEVEDADGATAAVEIADGLRLVPIDPIKPQPQPFGPISSYKWDQQGKVDLDFFGTSCEVRFDDSQKFTLPNLDPATVANAWRNLSKPELNNTINDCLKLRSDLNLNDWAYLNFLREFSNAAIEDPNAATLLMAFLYCQSGYKMRLLKSVTQNKLSMAYGSKYTIYGVSRLVDDDGFFYIMDKGLDRIAYVPLPFPNEQPLSLTIEENPKFKFSGTGQRTISSWRYPELKVDIQVDENMLSFFESYPSWSVDGDFLKKWMCYAQTPIDPKVKAQLYPQLLEMLDMDNKPHALKQLLNFVQTGFEYGYDEEIWGYDRPFFPIETLFYPKCDCEDRAVLFSRLVRDLLDYEVVLIYYPGHLATAVAVDDPNQTGKYVRIDGKRFFICDPTILSGTNVGQQMKNVDVTQMRAIRL